MRESVAPPAIAPTPTNGVNRASHAPSQVVPSERPSAPALEQTLGQAQDDQDDDAHLLADFFSSPPPAPEPDPLEDPFDEREVLRMSLGSRRAMWASLGLFGASVLAIGGFIAYHQLVMPAPVELAGASEGLSPLQPLAARPETSISAATDSDQPRYLLTAAANNPPPSAAAPMVLPGEEPAGNPGAAADPSGVQPGSNPVQAGAVQPGAASATQLGAAQGAVAQPVTAQPVATPPSAAQGAVTQLGVAPSAVAQPAPAPQRASVPAVAPSAAAQGVAAVAVAQAAAAQPMAATSPAPVAPPVLPVPVQPLASGNSPEPTFDELLAVAHSFVRRGNNQTALDAFEHALRVRPDAPSALSGKALTYLNLEDTQSAKLYASRAVAADPTNSEGWIVLGAAEEQLGSRDAAREAYRHCAEQGVGSYVVECRQLVR